MIRRARACAAGLGLGLLLAICATASHAALFEDDEARRAILDLRNKIAASDANAQRMADDLKRATDDNAQLRRSLLDLQSQLDAMRSDVARMTGQNEELARAVQAADQRSKDLAQGMDDRFRKFEPVKVTVDGREITADPAESRDYDAAFQTFRRGDFAGAQAGFVGFVKRYPQSAYHPSALFWLGNALYATRDYKEAIANFRNMLSIAPDHPRAPEAVLAIANCQIEMKDTRSARKTLEDLGKAYPQSEAAQTARERLARLK